MTRKLLALLLAMVMLFSFTACTNTTNSTVGSAVEPTDDPTVEPEPTETVYLDLTATHLDSIGKVTADIFDTQMNVNWNFGWEGDGSLEHNATKVDFDGTAAETDLIWRLGAYGAEGTVIPSNAGWGVSLLAKGEGNVAYMYNKVDLPEYATEFRVWGVSHTSNHWSGSGAVRAVALYKDADGNYVKHVFTPKADTFTPDNTTAFFDEKTGTLQFSNSNWSMPGLLDGCMIVYDMADLAGKEDVIIVIESVGLGTIFGDEYTEAAEGVPTGEVMPENFFAKRVLFVVEPPAPPVDPDVTQTTSPSIPADQEVYLDKTGNDLDALAGITGDAFADAMNVQWNFGWDGNPVAGKVDFAGTEADSTEWHLGTVGTASHGDAGWGVELAPAGVGSNAYMYTKLDVPAEGLSQFRIWTAILNNPDANRTGNGAIRAVACYKNEDGTYTRQILVPVGEAAKFYNAEDGTTRITAAGDWAVTGIGDGMIIYDMSGLAGKQVTIFVEAIGITEGAVDHFIVKRIIFC